MSYQSQPVTPKLCILQNELVCCEQYYWWCHPWNRKDTCAPEANMGYPADWQPAKKATLPLWQVAFLSLIALSKRQPWKYILFCPILSVSQCHSKIGTFLGPFWQFGPIGTRTVTNLYPWNFEDADDDIHMYADELLVCISASTQSLHFQNLVFRLDVWW